MPFRSLALAFAALFCCAIAGAQAVPAATRQPISVGAAFSFGSPDYEGTSTYIEGITAFATAPISRTRFAAELDMHFDSLVTPIDIGQNSYVIGPRYSVLREDRANVYVKALGGLGQFVYQKGYNAVARTVDYGVFAFGGGIEYQATDRINVRALDLEIQTWPGFNPSLHPVVASIGAAYTF